MNQINRFLPLLSLLTLLTTAFVVDRIWLAQSKIGAMSLVDDEVKTKQKTRVFKSLYTAVNMDSIVVYPMVTVKLTKALFYNEMLLESLPNIKHKAGLLRFTTKDLQKVNQIMLSYQHQTPVFLSNFVRFYQLSGTDQHGNIKITGYYSPFIEASHTQTTEFDVAIYQRPNSWSGALPTRQQIEDQGVMRGKGLEICYVKSKKDLYNLQMQGSGYVCYSDGTMDYVSYDGDNSGKNTNDDDDLIDEDEPKVATPIVATPIVAALVPDVKTETKKDVKVVETKVENKVVDYSKMSPAEIKKAKELIDLADANIEKSKNIKPKETAILEPIKDKKIGPAPISENDVVEEEIAESTDNELIIDEKIDVEAIHNNPRYSFFTKEVYKKVRGSGQVRLTEDCSIAIDRNIIPMGACLLAAVPVQKKNSNKITRELRFVVAQDTGGKIIGKGHIDLYTGAGKQALAKAKKMHHSGHLWLMLPK